MKRSKKYKEAVQNIDVERFYEVKEGVDLVKSMAFAKFNETVEVALKLNIKKNHSIRETFSLPHQFAAEKKVLVFAKGEKAREAEEAGAAYVGAEELVGKIKDGWLDFDVCVATPDMMREVGKLGPILGRRGLMPNPKTRTVTTDVKAAVAELKQGRIECRADKTGVVHLAVGKISMESVQLEENIEMFLRELVKKRPSDIKGEFVCSVSLSSTMGPGVKLRLQQQQA